MIENELLLLGLLKERPRHGYEIKIKIKEILALFAGVDLKSIYYPLSVLEKKGFVAKRSSKKGRRPERFVYALTDKGRSYFNELLTKSLLNFKRPQFSLDLSLYFLDYIKPAIARRRVQGRIFILKKISRDIHKLLKDRDPKKIPQALARILEHNLRMLDAEVQFLEGLIKTL